MISFIVGVVVSLVANYFASSSWVVNIKGKEFKVK